MGKDSEKCLDVKAKKKDDDSYEKWDEIKKHKVNNFHLYRCHDPATTTRVNQLWSWVPYQNGEPVTEKTEKLEPERLWEISDISLTRSGPVTVSGFAFFAAATMLGSNLLAEGDLDKIDDSMYIYTCIYIYIRIYIHV